MYQYAPKRSSVGIAVAIGLGAIAVLALLGSTFKKAKDIFGSFQVKFDGLEPGQSLQKVIGQTFSVEIEFDHQGPGGEYDVGVGFADAAGVLDAFGPVKEWVVKQVKLEPHTIATGRRILF